VNITYTVKINVIHNIVETPLIGRRIGVGSFFGRNMGEAAKLLNCYP
jgi:hypothetical protein